MSRQLYPRISAHCKKAKLSGNLDPITIIGKLRQGVRKTWEEGGINVNNAVSRFLDRVTLHLFISQDSDATQTLYKEIDKWQEDHTRKRWQFYGID
jgi:hypothetical protein